MSTFPPSYKAIMQARQGRFRACKNDKELRQGSKLYYASRPGHFVNDWGVTYDPRNVNKGLPALVPFSLFPRQFELIDFFQDCRLHGESGLVEKARDTGVTWCAVGYTYHLFYFVPGSSIGWGSRKEQLVDRLGDIDSIFEKIRVFINYLPKWFLPAGFDVRKHVGYMKIINPENGNTITGEAGDNIGRGGRKTVYFKDESAYYERPEKIEGALGDNTDCQIDISSVRGNTLYERRRFAGETWEPEHKIETGVTRVFIFDWRDHPGKDQAWYDRRRKKAEREGLSHVFAQEVDRDYTASADGVVIKGEWLKACIDAHKVLGFDDDGVNMAALDVADEGVDLNAFSQRNGVVLKYVEDWKEDDPGKTTRRAVRLMRERGCKQVQYDSIGVGAGVKTESNRLFEAGVLDDTYKFIKWNAAKAPLFKEQRLIKGDKNTPKNKDFYANLKAQAWWQLRLRAIKTYNAVVNGEAYDPSELISLSSEMRNVHDVVKELSQATYTTDGKGRVLIIKTPKETKSPNKADSIVMNYWPLKPKVTRI